MLDWLDHDRTPASISVVWLPMLRTDNAAAACSSATLFHDARVVQFWDPDRLSGLAWASGFQAPQARALLDSLPADEEYRPFLERWIADPTIHPIWDVAYFYAPEAKWRDRIPPHAAWTKQVAFWGHGEVDVPVADSDTASAGDTPGSTPTDTEHLVTGQFWTSRRPTGILESDWIREFQWGISHVSSHRQAR